MGIGSNANVMVGDVRINFLTSSEVAGSGHAKGHFISGGGITSCFAVRSAELQQTKLKYLNKEMANLSNLA